MREYQLIPPPPEGWRGRIAIIAEILRAAFGRPRASAVELQPLVSNIDEADSVQR